MKKNVLSFTRLNGDSSWLIEIAGIRLLLDPWLEGAQVDVGTWFNRQTHVEPCIYPDRLGEVDAVVISHPFTDHCHPDTLCKLPSSLPVIGPEKVLRRVRKLAHFERLRSLKVREACRFQGLSLRYYPSADWWDPVHGGIHIKAEGESGIFYAPHGFKVGKQALMPAEVVLTTFTHYRLPFFLGGDINLGYHKAMDLARRLGVKWILPTHDEDKAASGIVAKLAKVKRQFPDSLPEGIELLTPFVGEPVRLG